MATAYAAWPALPSRPATDDRAVLAATGAAAVARRSRVAATPLAAHAARMWLGVVAARAASASTPPACSTARSGDTAVAARAASAASVAMPVSARMLTRVKPLSGAATRAAGGAPDRPAHTTRRAPRAASHAVARDPTAPLPPVTRAVEMVGARGSSSRFRTRTAADARTPWVETPCGDRAAAGGPPTATPRDEGEAMTCTPTSAPSSAAATLARAVRVVAAAREPRTTTSNGTAVLTVTLAMAASKCAGRRPGARRRRPAVSAARGVAARTPRTAARHSTARSSTTYVTTSSARDAPAPTSARASRRGATRPPAARTAAAASRPVGPPSATHAQVDGDPVEAVDETASAATGTLRRKEEGDFYFSCDTCNLVFQQFSPHFFLLTARPPPPLQAPGSGEWRRHRSRGARSARRAR